MLLHETINWAFSALLIEDSAIRCGDMHQIKLNADANLSYEAGYLRLCVGLLLEDIELGVKARLERLLKDIRGANWWITLPRDLQRKSKMRYEWTVAEMTRVPGYPDVVWLSFGDVIKALDSLSLDEWRRCLAAETNLRMQFSKQLRIVKSFRDYHYAHPKPLNPTVVEVLEFCQSVRQMPRTICPAQSNATDELLELLKNASVDERKDVIWEGMGLSCRSGAFEKWVGERVAQQGTLGMMSDMERCQWRRELLSYLANIDPSGRVCFGIVDA